MAYCGCYMSKRNFNLAVAGLVLLTLLTYWPAMQLGGWIWDDDSYVTNNTTLQTVPGLGHIWANSDHLHNPQYYPLVHTTFWVEYHLWGLEPRGYHIDNVLLHALNAVLLWLILRKLALPGGWVVAAIFAVHPINVESVAWVTERKNVLSAAFYLGSMLAYLRFAGVGANGESVDEIEKIPPASRGLYGLSLLLFVCALLSKSVTCSLPVIIALLLWWKRPKLSWRDLWPLAPFFVIGLILGWHTAHMEKVYVFGKYAGHALDGLGPVDRGLIAGRALWFYAGKLLWPNPLIFIYPRWDINAGVWWQYLFPVGWVILLAGLLVQNRRIGRAPLVAVLYFSITLFPALGFVNVFPMLYSFVADHFQYLAGIAVVALLVSGGSLLLRRLQLQHMAPIVAGGVVVTLVALSWPQELIYQNLEILWSNTCVKNSHAQIAYQNLGAIYEQKGDYKKAIDALWNAQKLEPNWVEGYTALGNVYMVQWQMHKTQGDHDAVERDSVQALAIYREGLGIQTYDKARKADLYSAYGVALWKLDHRDDGLSAMEQAAREEPDNPKHRRPYGLGIRASGAV